VFRRRPAERAAHLQDENIERAAGIHCGPRERVIGRLSEATR